MSGNFVIAGGSKGIGLELVHMLSPTADRIDVYSRNIDDLVVNDSVTHHVSDSCQQSRNKEFTARAERRSIC